MGVFVIFPFNPFDIYIVYNDDAVSFLILIIDIFSTFCQFCEQLVNFITLFEELTHFFDFSIFFLL